MHLRKLLFIVISYKGSSTKVSLGRKKHFQKLCLLLCDISYLLLKNQSNLHNKYLKFCLSMFQFWEGMTSLHYFHTVFILAPYP